jgi:glyoxylase-like metal-dependent hydrolase (beta-lactamase superfamily II)
MVVGQELDLEHNQPDVANAVLHRVGDTVFLIDTGATGEFRQAIGSGVDQLGPWKNLVLLTTHGHPDHVGNNDLPDELVADRKGNAEHFVPALEVAQMRNPHAYWTTAFSRLVGIVQLPAPPNLVAWKIASMFEPYQPFGDSTRTFEDLPLEQLKLGSQLLTGWRFADGAVQVIRTQGHTAGHVVIYLRDSQVLHMGDDTNGACGAMHDADQVKLMSAFTMAARMIDDGLVSIMTDGHTATARDAATARTDLETMHAQGVALEAGALAAIGGQPSVDPKQFLNAYAAQLSDLGVGGANPNPLFTAMMSVNTLREFGITPARPPASHWSRPDVSIASPSSVHTIGRVVIGSGSAIPWAVESVARKTRRADSTS